MFCWKCGEDNNDRFTFCLACGSDLRSPGPRESLPSSDTLANTNDDAAITPPVFASNIGHRERKEKSGKYVLIAGVGLAFLIFLALAPMLMWRQISTGNELKKETNENGIQTAENTASANNNIHLNNRPQAISKADLEFDQIKSQLNSADIVKNKVAIESDVKAAKGRYPEDYRFAYQAAKLEAMTRKGHHEAFEMLFRVAKQAIETGKSAELLIDLQQDGKNSLRRLTDHKEWRILETALRNNDTKGLEVK